MINTGNTTLQNLQVDYKPIGQLTPYSGNARTHSAAQIKQIADSIHAFGFNNPLLIDSDNCVIAGHGRLQAAKNLGLETVPTIQLEHLSDDQRRAYILADNRLAEKAGWDKDILAIELEHLLSVDVDFDVTITGFSMPDIDILLGDEDPKADPDDDTPKAEDGPTVTQSGDLWVLGNHKIFCGDSLKPESYTTLLGDEQAQMVFTDPPYNVPIDGYVCGKGKVKHTEFAMASGEMTSEAFTAFLEQICRNMVQFSTDGSIHFVCMDWRHMTELLTAGNATYSELKNICVWNKNNGGMGSMYRSKHEMVLVFKNGSKTHINNVELGKHGRYRTNVWDYAGVAGRPDDLAMHPTVKPVALIADALLDCSKRKGLVLDPFGGSGSTLIAAERVGRYARLIELEPKYVDVTIHRWQQRTGLEAVHATTGKTFAETEAVEVHNDTKA